MEIANGQIKVNSKIVFSGSDPELSTVFNDTIEKFRKLKALLIRHNIQKIDLDRKRLINNCCFPGIEDVTESSQ